MNDNAVGKSAFSAGLGQLPKPEFGRTAVRNLMLPLEDSFSAAQMIAYAAAEVKAERERCIEWCRKVMAYHEAQPDCAPDMEEPTFRDGEACGAEDCIESIERYGDWP